MQIIPLRQTSGRIDLNPAHIVRIESSRNYSRVFFTNRPSLLVCQILQWFEDLLPDDAFLRVHRSHLVNRAFIMERTAETFLLMQNEECIPVSRRRRGLVDYSFCTSSVIPS